jgi:hypothetical protein
VIKDKAVNLSLSLSCKNKSDNDCSMGNLRNSPQFDVVWYFHPLGTPRARMADGIL